MKKILFLIIATASIQFASAQSYLIDGDGSGHGNYPYPPTSIVNGDMYWCGEPIAKMIESSEIIFEGRILSSSIHKNSRKDDDDIIVDYQVLVLKQFKGTFISDTIVVQSDMWGWKKGDEALFCLFSYGNAFHVLHGNGCGFIGVCNRKDVVKEVYEPIEAATGQKYIDVHPNTCATQKKEK